MAFALVVCLIVLSVIISDYRWVFSSLSILVLLPVLLSLLVSYYVYDFSGFYKMKWLKDLNLNQQEIVLSINAGFDETSEILIDKLHPKKFLAFDFYDSEVHTEVSIKRARKSGLIYLGTQSISTSHIPLEDQSVDSVFLIFSGHEIRNHDERIAFLKLLKSKTKGQIIVVEHLRDFSNFLAYTIGFLHFYSGTNWQNTFEKAGFDSILEQKINPFVRLYVLK
jgi:hypothetical protein